MYQYLHKKLEKPSLSMVFYPLFSSRKYIKESPYIQKQKPKEDYFFPPL